jgi:hypothetical protein
MQKSSSAILVAIAYAVCVSVPTRADDDSRSEAPAIEFDSKVSFPCREVTPREFSASNAERKVVEVTIRISANFSIEEKAIDSVVYRVKLPRHAELADYLPKTELASEISGAVEVNQKATGSAKMVVSFDAGGKVGYHVPAVVDVEARAEGGSRSEKASEITSGVQMKYLPPKQLIVSAGTQERGQILYYKLRPFSQITLEGEREFAFLLVVPSDWTGDCIQLDCSAFQKGSKVAVAHQCLGIGLYIKHDSASRTRVEELARKINAAPSTVAKVEPMRTETAREKSETANLSCAECAGKYKIEMKEESKIYDTKKVYELDLSADGTWQGTVETTKSGLFITVLSATQPLLPVARDTTTYKGTWSVADGKLTIKPTESRIVGIWINSGEPSIINSDPITSFDKKSGLIVTEKGIKLVSR